MLGAQICCGELGVFYRFSYHKIENPRNLEVRDLSAVLARSTSVRHEFQKIRLFGLGIN